MLWQQMIYTKIAAPAAPLPGTRGGGGPGWPSSSPHNSSQAARAGAGRAEEPWMASQVDFG